MVKNTINKKYEKKRFQSYDDYRIEFKTKLVLQTIISKKQNE